MTTRSRLTDRAVDELPLHDGRAELLEELLRTPVRDLTPLRSAGSSRPSRSTTWWVPVAAAAAVVALAAAPVWVGMRGSGDGAGRGAAASSSARGTDGGAFRVVLDAPGWKVDYADAGGLGIAYTSGSARLEISSRPASLYAEYVADRSHISDPPAAGDPVEVLGRPGQLWAYTRDDHTMIRQPQDDLSFEIRGQGLSRADFLDLLGRLSLVDLDGFEAGLPARFFTTAERPAEVEQMLAGIQGALGPDQGLWPAGDPTPEVEDRVVAESSDPYQLGVEVAGTVACAWLTSYSEGVATGDADQVADAAAVLTTSRQWPVALGLEDEGGWSEVLWSYADDVAAGRDVTGFESGLGCS